MRILVTGASGFVGHRLCLKLLKRGHFVYGTYNKNKCNIKNPNFKGIKINLLECNKSNKLPNVDILFHMASQQPSSDKLKFDDFYNGNVSITKELLKYYICSDLKLFVFSSSLNVNSQDTNYAITKRIAESITLTYSYLGVFKVIIIRYPSIYGPGEDGGLINYYYRQALSNDDIEVFGNGVKHRNPVHISDVINANLSIPLNIKKINSRDIFYVAPKKSMKMKDIAKIIIKKLKSKSKIKLSCKEVHDQITKKEKSMDEFGFVPLSISKGIDLYIKEKEKY